MNEEKYQKLLKEFEMLASIASHAIKDSLRQAKMDCEDILQTQDINVAQDISREIDNSLTQTIAKIEQLRQYSYLVTRKIVLEDVNCEQVLDKAVSNLSDKIKLSNAKVIKKTDLPVVKAGYENMITVFEQIIDNAIKFCEQEPLIEVSATKNQDKWVLCISDNAGGIEKFYHKLIFAMMQKLDPEDGIDGFGSGLAFCKRIVENYRGEIWIEPNENGSNFLFSLPSSS